MSGETAAIDRRLRGFASARNAWLECAIAFLTLAWVWPLVALGGSGTAADAVPEASGAVAAISWVVWVGCGVVAVVCLVRASPRAPRAVRRGAGAIDPAGAMR